MGGSAIAGDVVAALAAPRLRFPGPRLRTPQLPEFCGPHTLVVASSYSGDTVETLGLFEEAVGPRLPDRRHHGGRRARRRAEELGHRTRDRPRGPDAARRVRVPVDGCDRRARGDGDRAPARGRGGRGGRGDDGGDRRGGARRPARRRTRPRSSRSRSASAFPSSGAPTASARSPRRAGSRSSTRTPRCPRSPRRCPSSITTRSRDGRRARGAGFALIALRHPGEDGDVAARFPLSEEIVRGLRCDGPRGVEPRSVRVRPAAHPRAVRRPRLDLPRHRTRRRPVADRGDREPEALAWRRHDRRAKAAVARGRDRRTDRRGGPRADGARAGRRGRPRVGALDRSGHGAGCLGRRGGRDRLRGPPRVPTPTVAGHAGRLWIGSVGARALAIFQGRVHFYEGHGMALASITSRLSAELGARAMVLTAATGALDPEIEAGTLVVLRDHLNLMGENPLHGWRFPDGSPAFVDVSQVYDPELADLALASARARSTARIGRVASATASTSRSPGPRTRRLPRHACCGSSALRSWGCRWSPKPSPPGRSA